MTAAHIVSGQRSAVVTLANGAQVKARVLHVDKEFDLAILKLPTGEYPTARLGDATIAATGDSIIAVGFALDLPGPPSARMGIISRVFREPGSGRDVLQTDAAINQGDSGGAIVDMSGRVVGIISSTLVRQGAQAARGISFATSAEMIGLLLAR